MQAKGAIALAQPLASPDKEERARIIYRKHKLKRQRHKCNAKFQIPFLLAPLVASPCLQACDRAKILKDAKEPIAYMWELIKEFAAFLRREKRWWLWPLVLCLLLIGLFVTFGASGGIAWLMYPFL